MKVSGGPGSSEQGPAWLAARAPVDGGSGHTGTHRHSVA
jgi:hypothetical protein